MATFAVGDSGEAVVMKPGAAVSLTLSNVEVLMTPLLCEQTAKPIVAPPLRLSEELPTSVQLTPSGES